MNENMIEHMCWTHRKEPVSEPGAAAPGRCGRLAEDLRGYERRLCTEPELHGGVQQGPERRFAERFWGFSSCFSLFLAVLNRFQVIFKAFFTVLLRCWGDLRSSLVPSKSLAICTGAALKSLQHVCSGCIATTVWRPTFARPPRLGSERKETNRSAITYYCILVYTSMYT